ncbi:MAG: hypothetical protein IH946_07835 [Bacteroidetes bacterium]|nr:hypothetical protein [Bacteroidota bacterium]
MDTDQMLQKLLVHLYKHRHDPKQFKVSDLAEDLNIPIEDLANEDFLRMIISQKEYVKSNKTHHLLIGTIEGRFKRPEDVMIRIAEAGEDFVPKPLGADRETYPVYIHGEGVTPFGRGEVSYFD